MSIKGNGTSTSTFISYVVALNAVLVGLAILYYIGITKIWSWILAIKLAPVIALSLVYIAWQQWRTNHNRLKLELYDRRYKVYLSTMDFMLFVGQDSHIPIRDN